MDFAHPQGEVGAALGDQSAKWGWKQQASKAMGQSHGGVNIDPSGCRAVLRAGDGSLSSYPTKLPAGHQ